jgi:hypothetical protein
MIMIKKFDELYESNRIVNTDFQKHLKKLIDSVLSDTTYYYETLSEDYSFLPNVSEERCREFHEDLINCINLEHFDALYDKYKFKDIKENVMYSALYLSNMLSNIENKSFHIMKNINK